MRRVFSADARKKLRAKEKKLVEAVGPVACRRAATPEEVERFLAAFYAQKAARFAAMGIADPYADPAVRDFLARAASPAGGLGDRGDALVADRDGRVFAVFAGAVDAARYSGMMTAFDADPAVGRSAPATSCSITSSATRRPGAGGPSTSASARPATRPASATRPSRWARSRCR